MHVRIHVCQLEIILWSWGWEITTLPIISSCPKGTGGWGQCMAVHTAKTEIAFNTVEERWRGEVEEQRPGGAWKKPDVPLFGSESSQSAAQKLAALSYESSLLEWPSLWRRGRHGREKGKRRRHFLQKNEIMSVENWINEIKLNRVVNSKLSMLADVSLSTTNNNWHGWEEFMNVLYRVQF